MAVLGSDSRSLPCMQHAAFSLKTRPLPDSSNARTNTWNKLDSLTGCALAPDEFPNASEQLQFHSVKSSTDLRLTTVQSLIHFSNRMDAWWQCWVAIRGHLHVQNTQPFLSKNTRPLPDRSKARTNTWNKLDSLTGCALAPDEFPNASEQLQLHSVKSLADLHLNTVQSLIVLSSMCAWTLGGSAG